MPEPNAAQASLVFLGIVDFARKPVAEQATLRERLDAAVARSIAQLDPADRIVADAPDGLASDRAKAVKTNLSIDGQRTEPNERGQLTGCPAAR